MPQNGEKDQAHLPDLQRSWIWTHPRFINLVKHRLGRKSITDERIVRKQELRTVNRELRTKLIPCSS